MVLLVPIPLTVGFQQAVSCALFEIIASGLILKVILNQDLLDFGHGIDAPLMYLALILLRLLGCYVYDKWMRERILLKATLARTKVEFMDTLEKSSKSPIAIFEKGSTTCMFSNKEALELFKNIASDRNNGEIRKQ